MKTFSTQEKAYFSIILGFLFLSLFIGMSSLENRVDKFEAIPDTTRLKIIQTLEADDTPALPNNIIREYEQHPELYK